jgi:oxidase EvaA
MTSGQDTPFMRWLSECRTACDMRVRPLPWGESREWLYDGRTLSHRRNAFFRVVGCAVSAAGRRQSHLDQPLIDQPEIGVLGFLFHAKHGRPAVLVQAKPEPGNVGLVQAAPSVQATESNYRRRHGGRPTRFLGHFMPEGRPTSLSSSLQSEQGTVFLAKRNRNALADGRSPRAIPDGWRWFPLQEFLPALLVDSAVNSDARSVLASAPWRLLTHPTVPFGRWRGLSGFGEMMLRSWEAAGRHCTIIEAIASLRRLRDAAGIHVKTVPLSALHGWRFTGDALLNSSRRDLEFRAFSISCSTREVPHWDQPLAVTPDTGRAVLFCQERDGILQFLFRARSEVGFRGAFLYGPSWQEPQSSDLGRALLPHAQDPLPAEVLDETEPLLSLRQSDEGGRFYRSVSLYEIRRLPRRLRVDAHPSLVWLTLGQTERLLNRPLLVTNEGRTLVSMLLALL